MYSTLNLVLLLLLWFYTFEYEFFVNASFLTIIMLLNDKYSKQLCDQLKKQLKKKLRKFNSPSIKL